MAHANRGWQRFGFTQLHHEEHSLYEQMLLTRSLNMEHANADPSVNTTAVPPDIFSENRTSLSVYDGAPGGRINATAQGIHANTSKRADIGPGYFYRHGKITFRCDLGWSVIEVVLGFSWLTNPNLAPPQGLRIPNFAALTQAAAEELVRYRRQSCESCLCNEYGVAYPNDVPEYWNQCREERIVLECIWIYGCRCWADLLKYREKKYRADVTDDQIQNAIDDIPWWIQAANPDWSYKHPFQPGPHGSEYFTWRHAGAEVVKQVVKEVVKGVVEPYTIEGPNISHEDWTWLAGLGSKAYKRLVNFVAPRQFRAGRGNNLLTRRDPPLLLDSGAAADADAGRDADAREAAPDPVEQPSGGGDTTS
ncbi:hypothetical protein Dda_0989 [Drechslerella dactyloides]|uniref:Uncharacterized protein n=1 Tax=Drechslerella dactyloides TaxID=74499 RepID=A0AAD6NMJ0_DREDA|nr:hypothetical protein Dda_0989 [Drechslerella dactyloides]